MLKWSILRKISSWADSYHNLLDSSKYTETNAMQILNSYRQILSQATQERALNPQIEEILNKSLTSFSRILPKIQPHELVYLLQNLSKINTSHKIWNGIERKVLDCIKLFNIREIFIVVQCLANAKRKNDKVWQALDEAFKTDFLEFENFEVGQLVSIFHGFKSMESGSEALVEGLIERMCEKTQAFSRKDLEKLALVLIREDKVDLRLMELVSNDCVLVKDQLNPYQSALVLALLCKNQVDDEILTDIEKVFKRFFNRHTMSNFSKVCHMYGVYQEEQIKIPSKRQNFIISIENYFDSHRELLKIPNKTEVFKAMWGLSRSKAFTKRDLWQWYLTQFNSIKLETPAFDDFIKDLRANNFHIQSF